MRACTSTMSAGGAMPCPRCSNARCRAACNTLQRTTPQYRGGTTCSSARHAAAHDDLVYAIDVETQTFDIPGVKEHTSFMKEIQDAEKVSPSHMYSLIMFPAWVPFASATRTTSATPAPLPCSHTPACAARLSTHHF